MFELPEELDGLSASELDALLAAVRDEAADISEAMSNPDTADDASLERLETLAVYVGTLNAALATVEAAATARADKAAAALALINPVVEVPVVEEPVTLAVDEPVIEPVTPVVASVTPAVIMPSPRSVAQVAPKAKPPVADTRQVAIVAAAGLPGNVRAGHKIDLLDAVKPAVTRWESYLGHQGRIQDQLFTVQAPARDPRLVANGHNDQDVIAYAASEARLPRLADAPKGATGIIAAGGWCAPAEQRYDICTLAELDGILDVPTLSMPRGSLSYFRQLDYSTVATAIASGEFTFTNAQLVVTPAVVKPCFEIPCATPVTAVLDVVGLCIRAGLLQQKAFPELIAAWMDLAMIAFAHYRNARNIASIVAGSGGALVATPTFGALAPLLDWLSLQAVNYRFDNGMRIDAPLEIVLPFWVPALLQSDVWRRQFNSNQPVDLQGALGELNLRAQFVKDFVDAPFAGAGAVTTWPGTIDALMFAPGAWIRGTEDVITVSTLVDSTLLQTNRVQLLFFEAADQMLPYCGPSIHLQIPVCPSGATSGPFNGDGTAHTIPGSAACPEA